MWCDYVVVSLPCTKHPELQKGRRLRTGREEAVVMGVVDNERAA